MINCKFISDEKLYKEFLQTVLIFKTNEQTEIHATIALNILINYHKDIFGITT